MENRSFKGWLYLLPAIAFLGLFMIYPLVDVFVYSFEEGYNSASQRYFGIGTAFTSEEHDPVIYDLPPEELLHAAEQPEQYENGR